MEYGFSVNVKGNSLQEMQRISKALEGLGIKASSTADNVNRSFDRVADRLTDIGKKIALAFSIEKILEFGKEILNTTAEFEGFANRIKFASINSYDASVNMSFLRDEVEKLHMPMRKAYEGFSEMQAGLVGTGIEGKRLRDLFEGISSAAATLHLPEYSLQRTLYDLKEIGEIGINQRIVRSLSTALPGIGGIVKDTFHKSFQELEKEGISGGQFLIKLGPALSKRFAGGLEQFGKSLQAHLQDAQNSFTNFVLDLGKKLEPTFINILNGIRAAFNSAPVQLFVNHIVGIVDGLAKIIPMFIIYKTIMISISAYTRLAAYAQLLYQGAMARTAVVTAETAVATEAFKSALLTTGVGAFAVALGYIIEKFISINDEMDKAIEKVGQLDKLKGVRSIINEQDELEAKWRGVKNFTKEDKQAMLSDFTEKIESQTTRIRTELKPALEDAKAARAKYIEKSPLTEKLDQSIKNITGQLQQAQSGIEREQREANALRKQGITPIKLGPLGGGTTGRGLHGSHLSGAEGGLNQARIVNLKIDTVMKVTTTDNKNLIKHAEEAAGLIIRAANNLSESKSGTF